MEYPLKQIGCNDCGALTDILDIDAKIPNGWLMISQHTHYCPKCAKRHKNEEREAMRKQRDRYKVK